MAFFIVSPRALGTAHAKRLGIQSYELKIYPDSNTKRISSVPLCNSLTSRPEQQHFHLKDNDAHLDRQFDWFVPTDDDSNHHFLNHSNLFLTFYFEKEIKGQGATGSQTLLLGFTIRAGGFFFLVPVGMASYITDETKEVRPSSDAIHTFHHPATPPTAPFFFWLFKLKKKTQSSLD